MELVTIALSLAMMFVVYIGILKRRIEKQRYQEEQSFARYEGRTPPSDETSDYKGAYFSYMGMLWACGSCQREVVTTFMTDMQCQCGGTMFSS